MNSELKLLPCPFCGGEAGITTLECVVFKQKRYSVCCEQGCVEMPLSTIKKDAIIYWNTRTPNQDNIEDGKSDFNVEEVVEFISCEMDGFNRKPDYIFHKKFYPSSGVERMNDQEKQIRGLAQAICNKFSKPKNVEIDWQEFYDTDMYKELCTKIDYQLMKKLEDVITHLTEQGVVNNEG